MWQIEKNNDKKGNKEEQQYGGKVNIKIIVTIMKKLKQRKNKKKIKINVRLVCN